MEIRTYKTYEIEDDVWKKYVEAFNESFENHSDTTKDSLIKGFESNNYGYSFHAIAFDGNEVVGSHSITPRIYYDYDKEIMIGLGGSTFVRKKYRKDIFIFYELCQEIRKLIKREGMSACVGVANKNSYQYARKFLKSQELFTLSYYILPIRISKILKREKLKALNFLSIGYAYMTLGFASALSSICNFKEKKKRFKLKISNDILRNRFFQERYIKYFEGKYSYTYTLYDEDGINTAYIMDFRQNGVKSFKALVKCVKHIIHKESVDAIMYVGTLNIKQTLLLKVPHKFEPRTLHVTANVYKKDLDLGTRDEWDFSLLNLDVR